ncbi:MAG: hypothetical protein NZ581_05705, partial [Candidatus Caldarchaeum sp.]|nr:hypothetical protein [Candidatus Caldarchaeum sp.]MDW8435674.1 hypothetical protein [Candidatus Caldarchaeum sp.]
LIQELLRSYRSGGFEKLMQDIPETVLENLTAVGTPSEVRDRIEKYREAGVELPIIRPAAREIYDKVLAAVV